MTELPRITVTDANSNYLTFIDNNVEQALHYSSAKLHTYLTGTASTLDLTIIKTANDSSLIKEGCKLFFIYNEQQYAANVMRIEEDEYTMTINALSLSLELNNTEVDEYKATKQMEIAEYIAIFDTQKSLTIRTNELDYRRTLEWEGTSSLLARLLSLATKFDAEIKFETEVDREFNITATYIDIYKKNDDKGNQGIGAYHPEIKLSYGYNIKTIKRTVDINELQTSIRPIGKNGLNLIGKNYEEYNDENKLEYFSFKETGWIYAPFARDRFPSTTTGKNPDDRYMGATWEYDTGDQATEMINNRDAAKKAIESEQKKQKAYKEDHDKKLKELDAEYKKYVAANDSKKAEAAKKKITTENTNYDEKIKKTNEEIAKQQAIINTLTPKINAQQSIERDLLYKVALERLKEVSEPIVTYEIEGYFDLALGDTVRIYDDKFSPPLMLEARVSEQEIDFTNPENSKTTFTNFKVLESEISQSLLDRMNALIELNKTYNCIIVTDNGNTFKNGEGTTTLIPRVLDGITDISYNCEFYWFKNDVELGISTLLRVDAEDVPTSAVYRFEAVRVTDGKKMGGAEITIVNTIDGVDGQDGQDAYTAYLTNEAITLAADWNGAVSSDAMRSGTGQFIMFKGTKIVTSPTFSIVSKQDLDLTLDAQGNYKLTTVSKDYATATLRVSTKDSDGQIVAIQKTLTVSKSRAGKPGENGSDGTNGISGSNAITGRLTAPAIVVPSDPNGNVASSDLSKAIGNFIVMDGESEATENVSYRVEQNFGITTTIDTSTGMYRVTGMENSTEGGSSILSATYKGILIKQILFVSKVKQGTSGKGISKTDITYAISDSGTTTPSNFSSTRPTPIQGKYLWTKTSFTYTDGASKDSYSITLIGENGKNGTNGKDGNDGKGIYSTDVKYTTSSSGTAIPTSGWISTIPSLPNGYFMWSRTTITYTDNSTSVSYSVSKNGIDGLKGDSGIIVSETKPENPTINQLWQNSGTNNGYIKNTIYRWNGGSWVIHYFYATNIVADNLAAISANLGEIKAGKMSSQSTAKGSVLFDLNSQMLSMDKTVDKDIYKIILQDAKITSYLDSVYSPDIETGQLEGATLKMTAVSRTNGTRSESTSLTPYGITNIKQLAGVTTKRDINFNANGMELRADSGNKGTDLNSGIDLIGMNSYVDFHNSISGLEDYIARMWLKENGQFEMKNTKGDLILDTTETNNGTIYIQTNSGQSVYVRSANMNIQNTSGGNGNLFVYSVNGVKMAQSSSEDLKYNIKDMRSVLQDFKDLRFREYRRASETKDYQMGIILEENIKMPFTNTKDKDVDLYSYSSFIGKALQEEIKKREALEEKIKELEEKLNGFLQAD